MSALEVARRVAVAPQQVELGFDLGVREFVLLGRLPYLRRFGGETRRDIEAVETAMAATETLELQGRRMSELSGGERQRTVLAKALAQEPRVLLLDEPTSHLDIHHQMEVLRLVRRLNRESGMTVLAILHDMNLAAQYCDEVAVVKRGRVLRAGATREVMTREVLQEAFEVEVMVREDVVSGRPFVVPLEPIEGREDRKGKRVHIICGGGTGFRLMEELVRAGITTTAGVLNVGDTDYLVAKRLGIEVAEEAPFREISEESARRCQEMIRRAEVVVVTDVPFGPGNIRNLKILLKCQAARSGDEGPETRIFVQDSTGERDFSGGESSRLMKALEEQGALPLPGDLGEGLRTILSALQREEQAA
jgi:iron complex transport system ATP-binding protein